MQHVPKWAEDTNSGLKLFQVNYFISTHTVHLPAGQESCYYRTLITYLKAQKAFSWHPLNTWNEIKCDFFFCMRVYVVICALTVPPMRKSSPATYCMRSCCWQHPSTPMIQPKRIMDTAIPTKPAVILLRSASKGGKQYQVNSNIQVIEVKTDDSHLIRLFWKAQVTDEYSDQKLKILPSLYFSVNIATNSAVW